MRAEFRVRFLLLALGALALLAALWGGLTRMGWPLPELAPAPPGVHGPLLAAGFLGTLISLERAVALGHPWTYAGPLLTGLGGLAVMLLPESWSGPLLMTLGSLVMVAAFVVIIRRRPALFTATMGLGALALLVGNALWTAGWPIHQVSLWWAGFLVLTIAGERLDLSRLTGLSSLGRASFLTAATLFLLGLLAASFDFALGMRMAGASMVALALWLWRYDIARWTVRHAGLTRFIALCLLSGYVWLGASGLLALLLGGVISGPLYDAVLHALFLGFVLAMIFGHAPIVFPALLGWSIPFRPAFYAHLAILHLSLLLRVAGDLADWTPGRQWGGLLNIVALLVFGANTALVVLRSSRAAGAAKPQ